MPFIIPAQIMIISGPLKHKVPHCTAAAALAQFNLSCGRHEGWHALLHYSIMLVRLLLQIGGIQVAQLVITATLACEKKLSCNLLSKLKRCEPLPLSFVPSCTSTAAAVLAWLHCGPTIIINRRLMNYLHANQHSYLPCS